MIMLIAGLCCVIAVHALRPLAPGLRARVIERAGAGAWHLLHSSVSSLGLVLVVAGYAAVRREGPVWLWLPPAGAAHLTGACMLLSFILLAAAVVPGSRIARRVRQPLAAAVVWWAAGHLWANGTLGDLLLFGSLLLSGLLSFVLLYRRETPEKRKGPPATSRSDVVVLSVGVIAWAVFAFWLHQPLIGVRPFM